VETKDLTEQTLLDYQRAQELVRLTGFDDVHFFLLMLSFERLSPEERLAKGLARGRRKYFIIKK
jgi:hypothetical protein